MENIGYNYLVLLFLRQYVLDWINFSSFGRLFGQILFFKKKGGRKSRKSLLILNKYIANGYSGFHSTFRETVNSILQNVLQNRPGFTAIWTCWEPNAFDGSDLEYINEPGHDETGRFVPYWYRDGDKLKLEPLKDYDV